MVITATYDRLNRVLTVDDEDAGTTADTTYTYSLTSPAWTDPTGSYAAALDKFERPTAVNDPLFTPTFTWAYRADGQPSSYVQPNGNTTAFGYDAVGHLTSKNTTATGPVNRALYAWTYNRAGQVLTEAETVTGGASNGTITYAADALGQLSTSALGGTTTTYGWDKATNRTSVQVGAGTPATTAYDNANRLTSGANPSVTYGSDADGRLTARAGQTMTYDRLGRLTQVKNGSTVLAAYSYDPLDRLRIVDYTGNGVGGGRTRFRYVGMTTSAAQWMDDVAGTVTRNIANGWAGDRLFDWATALSDARVYGENAHHDVTWLANSSGTVSQSLRYDPFGNARTTPPAGYTPFRFQGSWYDSNTDLSWVVTRWYSQAQGRFLTEDTLLGQPAEPASRQLYAYVEGNPIAGWDPDGRCPAWGFAGVAVPGPGWLVAGATAFACVSTVVMLLGIPIGAIVITTAPPSSPAFGRSTETLKRPITTAGAVPWWSIPYGIAQTIARTKPIERVAWVARAIDLALKTGKPFVIIGETQGRVDNWKRYVPYVGTFEPGGDQPFNFDRIMRLNRNWINAKMDQGKIIIDIGLDRNRPTRGPFYKMEFCTVMKRGYPRHVMVPGIFAYPNPASC